MTAPTARQKPPGESEHTMITLRPPRTHEDILARHRAGPRAPRGNSSAFLFGWEACSVTIARDDAAGEPPRHNSAEWKRGWEARKAQATCAP